MEKLPNHENSVLKDLWRGLAEEASYRSTGAVQHSEIVIRLEGVATDTRTHAIAIIAELGTSCAALAEFRCAAFFTELIRAVTTSIVGSSDWEKERLT